MIRYLAYLQDLPYSLRRLLRTPRFTAAAVLIFGVGIGTTTAIFSHVNNVLLKPLGIPTGDRLAGISPTHAKYGREAVGLLAKDLASLQSLQLSTIRTVAFVAPLRAIASFGGEAQVVSGERVSGNYFGLLGVTPLTGRLLEPGDDAVSGARRRHQ